MATKLSRAERIFKLRSAIIDLRGVKKNTIKVQWIKRPDPTARVRILNWLEKLGCDLIEAAKHMKAIEKFEGLREMDSYLLQFHQPKTTLLGFAVKG